MVLLTLMRILVITMLMIHSAGAESLFWSQRDPSSNPKSGIYYRVPLEPQLPPLFNEDNLKAALFSRIAVRMKSHPSCEA